MISEIQKCRICGNPNLKSILHLGEQHLTGVFPKNKSDRITQGPLELVKCHPLAGQESAEHCGLVQLRNSYELSEMYGANYGYRSGLNSSMVQHLQAKVKRILTLVSLKPGDIVVDIGSNDSTLLQAYPEPQCLDATLIGIDPTGPKFKQYYPKHIGLIPEFFSARAFKSHFGDSKAKVITSIAMFYDLEDPTDFMRQIFEIIEDDGIWVFEQSYLPSMLETNAYDTVCHEHLEYYCLRQIKWMADRVGFQILDVELNQANGGSFSVTLSKKRKPSPENLAQIEKLLRAENEAGLSTLQPFDDFRQRVFEHRNNLKKFIQQVHSEGKTILGYGASTKGNVILQFCGLTEKEIPVVAEVNPDKFGAFTPGTLIPIISEADAKKMKPDYFLVLPWHFRDNLLAREKAYIAAGGKMFFPLPKMDVVGN